MSINYRADIDGLRAIAVVSVLIYHAFPNSLTGGFVGVDIFFVISGYLISGLIIKQINYGSFSFSDFYARRIKRIFPALVLMLIATTVAGYYIMMPSDFATLGQHVIASSLSFQNLLLLNESGYFDSSSELKPLLHIWSLGVEEQFYLVWPFALIAIYRFSKKPYIWIALVTAISFVACVIETKSNPSWAFYAPWFRLWELSTGALVYVVSAQAKPVYGGKSDIISMIAFTAIAYSVFNFHSDSNFPGVKSAIPVIGSALLIGFCGSSYLSKLFLSDKRMVYIGKISYPMYIWHWPILSFYFYMSPELTGLQDSLARVSILLVSVALSSLTYHFVETKIRNSKGHKSSAIVGTLCATTIIITTTGFVSYRNEGFPDRFGNGLAMLSSPIKFEWEKHVRGDKCHIMGDEDILKLSDQREDNCVSSSKHSVVLWGDSHAGASYPGVEFVAKSKGYEVTQITGAKRGPLFNVNKYVDEQSRQAIEIIAKTKPSYVILDARWYVYGAPDFVAGKISESIARIRTSSPNSKVVVIGQVPEWNGSLQASLFQLGKTGIIMPKYTEFGLNKKTTTYDSELSARLKQMGVWYVSPTEIMCSENGCLTSVGKKPTDLTAIDYGHLSRAGSIYMISRSGIFK
ncbi:TPA: acyltransferase [Escherichia coli]|nr:acyltransferase [Escherichia coli]